MIRRTTRIHALAAAFLTLSLPALSDSLTGKVVDPQGAVVAGAEVTLFDKTSGNVRKTTTSAMGDYNFADIPAGTYLMEAQGSGSAMTASQDITVSGSTTQDVNLSVARSAVRVLVTATSTPVSEQEVVRVVDVVDNAQIEQRDETQIGEVLRTMPGIQIQTQVGGITQIRTRGLPNEYTTVLIDGMRFRDIAATQADASGFISDMNVTDQSRLEFLRGSSSSLYGTNAVAGAINISSNDGGGRTHGALRTEGGGLGMFRGTFNLAGGLARDRFVYSGGASHLNVTSGVRGKTPNRNSSGSIFGKYYFTPKLSLSGRIWGADVWQRSVEGPAFPAPVQANWPAGIAEIPIRLVPDSQISLFEQRLPFAAGNATVVPGAVDPDGFRVSPWSASMFVLRHDISENASFRGSYSLVDTNRAFHDGPAGPGSFDPAVASVSNFDGRLHQLQLRFDHRRGIHQFTGGYEFEAESTDGRSDRPVGAPVPSRTIAEQTSNSIYGQEQLRFLQDRLTIAVGGRIQVFNLKDPSFSGTTSPYETAEFDSPENAYTGDASIAYFARSGTKIRFHFGNGYRAPSLYERFGSGYFQGSYSFYGDPRLPSVKTRSFDTGIDQWLFNDRVRASVTFYYTDLQETIIFANSLPQPDPFGRFFGYANAEGGGISRGVELSTQFSPTSTTSVTMSYTYNNGETRNPTIGNYFFDSQRTARNIFSMTATQWFTRRLNATFDFYGLGDLREGTFTFPARVVRYPGAKKADLVVNYNLPLNDTQSLDIYTKIENLGNVRYTDSGFLAPQTWAIGGVKWNF